MNEKQLTFWAVWVILCFLLAWVISIPPAIWRFDFLQRTYCFALLLVGGLAVLTYKDVIKFIKRNIKIRK